MRKYTIIALICIIIVTLVGCTQKVEMYDKIKEYNEKVFTSIDEVSDEKINNVKIVREKNKNEEEIENLLLELEIGNDIYSLEDNLKKAKQNFENYEYSYGNIVPYINDEKECISYRQAINNLDIAKKLSNLDNVLIDNIKDSIDRCSKVLEYKKERGYYLTYSNAKIMNEKLIDVFYNNEWEKRIKDAYDNQLYVIKEYNKFLYLSENEKYNIDINKQLRNLEDYYMGKEIDLDYYKNKDEKLKPRLKRRDSEVLLNRIKKLSHICEKYIINLDDYDVKGNEYVRLKDYVEKFDVIKNGSIEYFNEADLNSDGIKDKVKIKLLYNNSVEITVNDAKKILDGENFFINLRFVDIDKSDKFLEFIIEDDGPSGDPSLYICRYDKDKIIYMGKIAAFFNPYFNGKGQYVNGFDKIFLTNNNVFHTVYTLKNNKFNSKAYKFDNFINKKFILEKDIKCYIYEFESLNQKVKDDWLNTDNIWGLESQGEIKKGSEIKILDLDLNSQQYLVEVNGKSILKIYFWIGD